MSFNFNYCLKNIIYSNIRLLTITRSIQMTQVRCLYSPVALGIDSYLQDRKRMKEQFSNYVEKFKNKMSEFLVDDKNMIFTEDLKNMVHIAEACDIDIVLRMIKKFNTQSTEFRFGSFVFGPVVMRMFHFLDAPKEALKCFHDPANEGFFDQQTSYQILLDLLYVNQMFDEMYGVFERVKERQLNMVKFPKYSVILIMAACYKQNTPESMEYASKLWTEMNKVGSVPLRRASTFFAALALKQGVPQIALEVISGQKQHYVTIRNIKVIALAEMNRAEDALPILRAVIDADTPYQKHKNTFFEETISSVSRVVEQSKNTELQKEYQMIEKALRDRQLVDKQTLDQLLNAEIQAQRTQYNEQPMKRKTLLPYTGGRRHQYGNRTD